MGPVGSPVVGWEYASVELQNVATDVRWVARTETEELASGKRLAEIVDTMLDERWELVDLTGKGAHLRRRTGAAG